MSFNNRKIFTILVSIFIGYYTGIASANQHYNPGSTVGQPSHTVGSAPVNQLNNPHNTYNSERRIKNYWTAERMRNARPLHIGIPTPRPVSPWRPIPKRVHRDKYGNNPVELKTN